MLSIQLQVAFPGRSLSQVSLIAGGLIQVISAINFYLYFRASRQFATFHICLERTRRFLLANSLCENLITNDLKDKARLELIDLIANAPMLTAEPAAPAQDRKTARARKRPAKSTDEDSNNGDPKIQRS